MTPPAGTSRATRFITGTSYRRVHVRPRHGTAHQVGLAIPRKWWRQNTRPRYRGSALGPGGRNHRRTRAADTGPNNLRSRVLRDPAVLLTEVPRYRGPWAW